MSETVKAALEEARVALADDPPPDEIQARIQALGDAVDQALEVSSAEEMVHLLKKLGEVLNARKQVLARIQVVRKEISTGVEGEKSFVQRLAESKELIATAQLDADKLRNELPEGAVDKETLDQKVERSTRMREEIGEREAGVKALFNELESLVKNLAERRTARQEAAAALEAVPPPSNADAMLTEPEVAKRRLAEQQSTLAAREYREVLWLLHKARLELEIRQAGLAASQIRLQGTEAQRLRYQAVWDAQNTLLKSKDLVESLEAETDRVEKLKKDLPQVAPEEKPLAKLRLEVTEHLLELVKTLSETTSTITEVIQSGPAAGKPPEQAATEPTVNGSPTNGTKPAAAKPAAPGERQPPPEAPAQSSGGDALVGPVDASPPPGGSTLQIAQEPAMVLDVGPYVAAWKEHASGDSLSAAAVATQYALVVAELGKLKTLEERTGKRPETLRKRFQAADVATNTALAAFRKLLFELESRLESEAFKGYLNNFLSLEVRLREYRKLFDKADEELIDRIRNVRERQATFQLLVEHLASLGKKSLLIRARRDLTWESLSGVASDGMSALAKMVGFFTFRDENNLGSFFLAGNRWRASALLLGAILISALIAVFLSRRIDRTSNRLLREEASRVQGPPAGKTSASSTEAKNHGSP